MSIFEFDNYKSYLKSWIEQRPKKGRGELKRLAELLRVHSTMMSHILRGNAQLSLEQGTEVAQYLGLSDLETDFFLELVQLERAGTLKLKKRVASKIETMRKRALQLKERLGAEQRTLTEADHAIFYSSWHFSAIRLLATLGSLDPREIQMRLGLSSRQVNESLQFLIRTGLCEKVTGGKIQSGSSITHLGADSPHVWKHHQSWRLKAIDRHYDLDDSEIMYSAPLTISTSDMAKFREHIVTLIADLKKMVQNTEPENLACLNIDWFKVAK